MAFSVFKRKKKEKEESGPVGGFAFFLSLASMVPLTVGGATFILIHLYETNALRVSSFAAGCIVGLYISHRFIRGRFAVFLHELKHSLVSNLVGNKWKNMKVEGESGHFEYAYYKSTKHFNAFINLAPYCLPLATLSGMLLGAALSPFDDRLRLLAVGIGYGADLSLNTRDISPIQSDIHMIVGGFTVGLFSIICWNIGILSLLLIWILFGLEGYAVLMNDSLDLAYQITIWIKPRSEI